MRRVAREEIILRDGTKIPKGTAFAVHTCRMRDSNIYPNADRYDGYRFVRWRDDPDMEHKAHLVSTSDEHLGFGNGKHACPGRFFAANEAKLILCHVLLKYDWKVIDPEANKIETTGLFLRLSDRAKIAIKRREEEIELV